MTFRQYITESPDHIHNASFQDRDARAFIVGPNFFCMGKTSGVHHGHMLIELRRQIILNKSPSFNKEMTDYNNLLVFGGDFSLIKDIIEIDTEDRSYLLRFSQNNKFGILVGRLWLTKNELSLWNNIIDVKADTVEKLVDLAEQYYKKDLSVFTWEVFEKENPGDFPKEATYTLDELEERLWDVGDQEDGELTDSDRELINQLGETPDINPQWKKLHLTPPEQKGQMMKNMGIRPKAPMGAEARYLRGESTFKNFFNLFLEMPQRIDSKIKMSNLSAEQIQQWYELVDTVVINNRQISVWERVAGTEHLTFFMDGDKKVVESAYDIFGKGIKENLVIQNPEYPGMARAIYLQYYLSRFGFILSDSTMTEQGFLFWKKLWQSSRNIFRFGIYDEKTKKVRSIKNEGQLDQIFGKDKANHYLRMFISK